MVDDQVVAGIRRTFCGARRWDFVVDARYTTERIAAVVRRVDTIDFKMSGKAIARKYTR